MGRPKGSKNRPKELPLSLTAVYQPHFEVFTEWESHNRQHQQDALQAIDGEAIGQISMPTGTGKTRVQIAIHVKEMIEMCKRGDRGLFAISAHRLALCSQLMEEMIAVAVAAGLPFDILFIGSSRFSDDKIHARFKNEGFNRLVNQAMTTTQSKDVKNFVLDAKARNQHVLCVSTYHSFDKLSLVDKIDTCTYDEAHTIVSDKEFQDNIEKVKKKNSKELLLHRYP
jgi:superfamily II DNA or RNA helicase